MKEKCELFKTLYAQIKYQRGLIKNLLYQAEVSLENSEKLLSLIEDKKP